MKNFVSRIKSVARRCKVAVVAAVAAVSSAVVSVCASAATTEVSNMDMATLLSSAGEKLQGSFGEMVLTLIPIIIDIMGSALVIYAIIALIKLAKKIFGKVTS